MEANKDYVVRVLKIGGFESQIEGQYVVLADKTPQGWTIKMYPFGGSIDVWIEKPAPESGAWVEVHLPIPNPLSSHLSALIRWAAEVITTATVLPLPKKIKKVIDAELTGK